MTAIGAMWLNIILQLQLGVPKQTLRMKNVWLNVVIKSEPKEPLLIFLKYISRTIRFVYISNGWRLTTRDFSIAVKTHVCGSY